ncbi:MAG TPA: energy-coupling factor transporter transmembrane component T [Anaerolineaceae bacterium]|nr:energy-coupling factor transporter transmembrane component T [Anaerolineaceae bacterium]HPN52713.1 energy-coupling factor transporter transmembrane component T [Anaerolineaceae bacterium]
MLVSFGYRPRGSLIEKLDPRARWIFSLLTLFSITSFWDARFLAFFFVLTLGQYALSRLTWKETSRAWLMIFFLMGMMILINTLLTSGGTIAGVITGGRPVFQLDGTIPLVNWPISFSLTLERLWFALCQVLRILSISLLFVLIPFTMDPHAYGSTFKGMGFPDKLAFSMDLAFRFVPTLGRDFSTTLDAQRARGYEVEKAEGGIFTQIRKMAPLIVPVTMNAILSGEDIVNAMDLRCFGLRARTWINNLRYQWYDWLYMGLGVILLAGSVILKVVFNIGGFWMPF